MTAQLEIQVPTAEAVRPSRWMIVSLMLGVLVYGILSAVITPALGLLEARLHTTVSGVTWLLTAYLLAAAIGTAVIGRLGDMFGKRRMLLIALAVMTLGAVVSAVTDQLALVVVGRALQGLAGGILPLAFGIIRDEFPRDRVGHAIGAVSSMIGAGLGVGVILPGLIATPFGWQWLFLIPAALGGVALIGSAVFVPESPTRSGGRVNVVNALLLTVGIAAVLVGISRGPEWGWASPLTMVVIGAGIVVSTIWAVSEIRSRNPLLDLRLLRIRALWATNVTALLLGAAMFSTTALYPIFAQVPPAAGFGFGASPLQSGLWMLPYAAAVVVAGSLLGRIARRTGFLVPLIAGCIICAIGTAFFALEHDTPVDLMISTGTFGFGLGLATSALATVVVESTPVGRVGETTGMNTVIRMIGGAVGTQVVATLIAPRQADALPRLGGFTASFALEGAFLLLAAAAAVLSVSITDVRLRSRRTEKRT